MGYNFFDIVLGVVILLAIVYYYLTSTYDFWSSRGVPGPKPSVLFGNMKDVMLGRMAVHDFLMKNYQIYENESMWGVFTRRTPVLVVKDPEFINDILVKDFSLFADRGMKVDDKVEPLTQHLFRLEPERWRPLRTKLSPVFTSGKLKEMFYLMLECADHFEDFLRDQVEKNSIIDCRELSAKYTTDVIGVCAFGLKMNALTEEDSEFRKFGKKFFEVSRFNFLKYNIRVSMPRLFNLLKPLLYDREFNDFFINMMAQTIDYRQENNIKRKDLVDFLINLKNNPSYVGDSEMTIEQITAQAFVFFAAGFEASSTTISNALYEMAQNHTIQNELRNEIKKELDKSDGKLTFEGIKNMKYLHKVFCETLRKYPQLPTLTRVASKDYTFSKTKISIPKNMHVWIPVYGIHQDPKIYPDPQIFDPERFDYDTVKSRHPSFYLPFGNGPRNCIGARFANYQTKMGLIKILKDYRVDVCDKTCIPYVSNPRAFFLQPIGGIELKFTRIK